MYNLRARKHQRRCFVAKFIFKEHKACLRLRGIVVNFTNL